MRQRLVAMNVQAEGDAGLQHGRAHHRHLGAAGQAGGRPFPVQIGTGGIGPQMAAEAAIGVHVRHHHQICRGTQARGHRVGGIGQPVERALHPPAGHGLPRMLAADDPADRPAAVEGAHRQRIERPAIDQHLAGMGAGGAK